MRSLGWSNQLPRLHLTLKRGMTLWGVGPPPHPITGVLGVHTGPRVAGETWKTTPSFSHLVFSSPALYWRGLSWVWWFRSVISASRRLRQEDHTFKVSLSYSARHFLENEQTTTKP